MQQAFPYLSAKQLGDVLLSTANNNITNKYGYFVTTKENSDGFELNVLYMDAKNLDNDGLKALLEYFKNNKETSATWLFGDCWEYYFGDNGIITDTDELKNLLESNKFFKGVNTYYNVPLDVIFGQGIVDAGKAVNGLGAINVRRLDKSDISSKYTVQGNLEKQALYTVDTQGYNSTWSNNIGEIRAGYIDENPLDNPFETDDITGNYDEKSEEFAGLTDLHDRWVFYTTNSFDNNEKNSPDYNWMVKHYIKQYNQQVAASGLAGLHAGLYKTGEGILALAGDNTYKGASIAAGGTLQIDGSVAGDAYSEGAGTIAGSGTINGSL